MPCTLQPYREFAPTPYDCAGAFLDQDRQAWLVAPCTQTRDSKTLERANWQAQENTLNEVDPEAETWEIHHFGHWGPGWFEIALVQPETPAAEAAQSLAYALADYPVLDDALLSQLEVDTVLEAWQNWAEYEVRAIIADKIGDWFGIDCADWTDIQEIWTDLPETGNPYTLDNGTGAICGEEINPSLLAEQYLAALPRPAEGQFSGLEGLSEWLPLMRRHLATPEIPGLYPEKP